MANAPEFLGPDGIYRTNYIFSTVRSFRFFTGRMDISTVDMQVSIRGAAFSSNPDLITFEGVSFTVPNPTAYPEGLPLLLGDNVIDVRAISTSGAVSGTSSTTARLVQEGDLGLIVEAPSGISIEKMDGKVRITVEGLENDNIQGYNFYAAVDEGGGADGYFQINPSLVNVGDREEVLDEIGTLAVDADVKLTPAGVPAADPLFLNYVGTQQNSLDVVLQTDFNESLEVAESVRKVRTNMVVSSVREVSYYSFTHDRSADTTSEDPAIPNNEFNAIAETDPLYYVVTAVYYDPTTQLELESFFSPELVGYPILITPAIGTFPNVTRQQLVDDTALSIFRTQPQVSIQAGAVVRDTFIDPFSTEAERLRFLVDFLHRAQSFTTLLPIDDPTGTGESVPVSESNYKLALKAALFLVSDDDVQAVIDASFEHLASKFGVFRRSGRRSAGEATFYTKRVPPSSVPVPIGSTVSGGGLNFRTTENAEITLSNIASFFNPVTGRYSVRVAIQAEDVGEAGNVSAGQITSIEDTLPGLLVVNEGPTFGGAEEESNRDLAARAQGRLSSVDSGTYQGYRQAAIDAPGVEEVRVIEAGNPLMQRDYDPVDGEHRGGRVDIWIRGENLSTVTDAFAFSFEIGRNIQFQVIGNPQDLIFRAVDPRLSTSFPIIEMLEIPVIGYVFRNVSKSITMSLIDVQILDYNLIQLSDTHNDPTQVDLNDVVLGYYRYRTSDKFVFPRQPVRSIESLEGTVTGEVSSDTFALYHPEAPLAKGRSINAGDYLQIVADEAADQGLTIPSGDPVSVVDEDHVFLGEHIEYLQSLGANQLTVHVYNEDRTIEYNGPFSVTGATDFTIIDGTQTSPVGLKRTDTGSIASGQTVLIDYEHDENFTVTYVINSVVSAVQRVINATRHAGADVLVKESIPSPVDISATIVLNQGASPDTTGALITTNLANYFGSLGQGIPLRQSDIIGVVETTDGVSYIIVPLTKMVREEGATVVREELVVQQDTDYTLIRQWSSAQVSVYLLTDALKSATTNGGGPENEFRGVFQSDAALSLVTATPNAQGVPLSNSTGNSFIIGSGGISITGYTDDATLFAEAPYTTLEENQVWVAAQRKSRTANRVLVTLDGGVSTVPGEGHNLVGNQISFLAYNGIFSETIAVWNSDRTVQYTSTGTSPDYVIDSGTLTTPTGIRRVAAGTILSGQHVLVDYQYHEPQKLPTSYDYTVTYVVGADSGTKNVEPGEVEFVEVGNFDFTYDEDV